MHQQLVNLLINVMLDYSRNAICCRIYCARLASRSNVVHCCWHVDLWCCEIFSFPLCMCLCSFVVCYFYMLLSNVFFRGMKLIIMKLVIDWDQRWMD